MFRRPLSLRTRLALGYTAFFIAVLALLSVGIFLAVEQALLRQMDRELRSSGELIQDDFDISNAALTEYFDDPAFLVRTHPPRVEGLESPSLYVQAATITGTVVVSSQSLQGRRLPLDSQMLADARAGQAPIAEVELGDAHVLMQTRPLYADQQIAGVLQVAEPLREVDRTLQLLMISLAAIGLIALLAGVRGGAWLASRALLPVGEVARTARQIVRAEDLGQRVSAAPGEDELGQLTSTVNEMLERLEALFNSQRRFVADVAHELRTPLTAMRGNLEILRRRTAGNPHALDESLAAMEREVNRLVRLASDLLLLAQVEVGAKMGHEPVALDELVLEAVRDLAPLANGVALIPEIDEQMAVPGDRDRLKQALLNIVTNALQHTPPGGRVQIALARDDGRACLRVSDTGAGIAADDLPHVFERFYRGDKSRARRTGGAGLGLAIVKWVAEAHGGAVEAHSAPGQGSTFVLTLPLQE